MNLKRISTRKFLELYLSEEFDNKNLFCSKLDGSRDIIPSENVCIDLNALKDIIYHVYDDKLSEYQEKIRDVKCEK